MKKSHLWILVAIAIAALAAIVVAQGNKPASPAGEATLKFDDGKTVTIEYSRPSMRGRKIFGGLVPYDQVWRTGANAATSLKTDVALTIGAASVPAGNYTLYTLPGATSWKLIINKQTGQWGTEYNQSQDLARVDMKVNQRSVAAGRVHHLLRQDQRQLRNAQAGMGHDRCQRRCAGEEVVSSPKC